MNTKSDIEAFLRDHVELSRALLAKQPPRIGVQTIADHRQTLATHYGEAAVERIEDRARALVREVLGGEDAPPLANAKIDPLHIVEADIIAEQLAADYRRNGVRPSSDPHWRDTLNARYAALFTRHCAGVAQLVRDLESLRGTPARDLDAIERAIKRAHARRAPEADFDAAVTLVRATVERATLHRADVPATVTAVETRSGDVPAVYRGTWTADAEYRRGSMVTLNGVLWHAEADRATDRPGTSPAWKLMHKSMEKR